MGLDLLVNLSNDRPLKSYGNLISIILPCVHMPVRDMARHWAMYTVATMGGPSVRGAVIHDWLSEKCVSMYHCVWSSAVM